MGVSTEQRKHLSAIRKLIKSPEWAEVKQGVSLLTSLDDPELGAVFTEGVELCDSGSDDGRSWKAVSYTHLTLPTKA